MDCPSEENLIRMKLDIILSITNLDFDIPLTVFHTNDIDQIEKSILELNLGGKILSTKQTKQILKKIQTKKSYFGQYLLSISLFLLSN